MKEKIYLLPGLMTDERLWSRLVPLLDEYELVHTPLPMTEDFDEASKELEKIFKEDKINLLGFSLGAYLACKFTINNPSRVKKLFLVAGSPAAMDKEEIVRRKITLNHMNKFGLKGLSHKKVLSLIEEENYKDEELITIIKKMFIDLGLKTYDIQMKSTFNRTNISKELINLKIPTRIFYSTQDRLFSHEVLDEFTKDDEHITLISRKGLSHMLPLEEPQKLAQEIKKWLK